ncbi:MAG TPA: response regulator transcription factor [Dehalococcoidia bacterium]|jgi:DNA-binding response OmpR family regulator|nr:response regulator transcription factor [Dehalococcoidia bacterium]
MSDRILVVEDEAIVAEVVERFLRREGYETMIVGDGREALNALGVFIPDLIVLDVMLPEVDGLEVCRQVRSRGATPIIMLTARGEETDKVLGLGLGADDYVTKPFSPRELAARVQAVLRRAKSLPGADAEMLRYGALRINARTRVVDCEGVDLRLTAREFDLLLYLARNAGQVFSRDQLLDAVWDYDFAGDAGTVTVHMRRLREKIEEDPARPRYLKTVWGVGYKFEP